MNIIPRRDKPVQPVFNGGESSQKPVTWRSGRARDLPYSDLAVLMGREDFPRPKCDGFNGPGSSIVYAKSIDLSEVVGYIEDGDLVGGAGVEEAVMGGQAGGNVWGCECGYCKRRRFLCHWDFSCMFEKKP